MKFYVTFGQAHSHIVSGKTFDKDCVAVIKADSYQEAEKQTIEAFKEKYCFLQENKPNMEYFPRGFVNL